MRSFIIKMAKMIPAMGTTALLQSVSMVCHIVVPLLPLAPVKFAGCVVKKFETKPETPVSELLGSKDVFIKSPMLEN